MVSFRSFYTGGSIRLAGFLLVTVPRDILHHSARNWNGRNLEELACVFLLPLLQDTSRIPSTHDTPLLVETSTVA